MTAKKKKLQESSLGGVVSTLNACLDACDRITSGNIAHQRGRIKGAIQACITLIELDPKLRKLASGVPTMRPQEPRR